MRLLLRLLLRRPVSLVVTVLVAGSGALAFALTVNPIDPALPLTIHTRATCLNGTIPYPGNQGNTTVQHSTASSGAIAPAASRSRTPRR